MNLATSERKKILPTCGRWAAREQPSQWRRRSLRTSACVPACCCGRCRSGGFDGTPWCEPPSLASPTERPVLLPPVDTTPVTPASPPALCDGDCCIRAFFRRLSMANQGACEGRRRPRRCCYTPRSGTHPASGARTIMRTLLPISSTAAIARNVSRVSSLGTAKKEEEATLMEK